MLRVLNIISARIKIRRILNIAEAEPNLPDTYKKSNGQIIKSFDQVLIY